ncbi:MAG: hypothetical protein KIH09_14350 [Candidatus Freyarchaeota archaeon]|nr:hypothetical protein [Candidatus Jordarchaeia archaeon]
MSDDFSEILEFANDKKVKELAEIISGVVKIILNAVDMLEGRMNGIENRLNSLENKISDIQRSSGPSLSIDTRRRAPSGYEQEEDYEYKPAGREPPPYSRPTPAPSYGGTGGIATARGPGPGPSPGPAGGGPMSARMQLQGELKDLFARMRSRRE